MFFSSYVFLFIFGLAVGSFINVVAKRYQPGRPLITRDIIFSRSHCPYCQKQLRWYELVPLISFIVQGGRCRSCAKRISWQYPLVELFSGLLFVVVPLFFKNQILFVSPQWLFWLSALWIFILLVLLLISLIDLVHFYIPDILVLLLALSAFPWILFKISIRNSGIFVGQPASPAGGFSFLRYYAMFFPGPNNIWLNHLMAALLGGLFFGLLVLFSRGRAMGVGDVKLALALGWIFGWPDFLIIFMLTFILGGLTGGAVLASGRKNIKDYLPLAPFFALAVVLLIFGGFQIINGYFRLFGL